MEELDVVNNALVAIGSPPISDVLDTDPAASSILTILNGTSGDVGERGKVLRRGWGFNEECVSLAANSDGEVIVPDDHLVFRPDNSRLTVVGGKVRDKQNRTTIIDSSLLPVTGDAILDVAFVDIPDAIAEWISAKVVTRYAKTHRPDLVRALKLEERDAQMSAINAYPEEVSLPVSDARDSERFQGTIRAFGYGVGR